MDMSEVIEYLERKHEALEFWKGLRDVIPVENKIKELESEIKSAKEKLGRLKEIESS
jgi:hypothetical protein